MTATRYDIDFYAWLLTQAAHVRARAWNSLDIDNLAEELETLGRSERHGVWSHTRILLLHLLKCAYHPERSGRSWRGSITRARQSLARRLPAHSFILACHESRKHAGLSIIGQAV